MAFELVFVLGMVEGQMPPLGREDPLLPDDERRDLDAAVPLRLARRAAERRDYLALLAAGRRQVLMYPRAEMRGPSPNLPARWLLDAASTLAGEQAGESVRVVTAKFAELEAAAAGGADAPWLISRASFHAVLKGAVKPANAQEYDLRGMARASDPLRHFAAISRRQVRRGIAATRGRRSGRATEWDGIVAARSERSPAGGRVASATGLETWAKCPFSYFMRTVLHVAETEAPEETLVITGADRGTLMHRALQLFFAGGDGFEAAPARTTREERWTGAERERLRAIGEVCCVEAEQAGQTGKPLLWGIERKRILRELDRFLDAEEGHRARDGFAFNAAEFQFGYDNGAHPALVVALADGREVAFRGSIDRVEQSLDGEHIAVVDYKTGRADQYKSLETNPLQDGQLLQLPIYGLAAADAFGAVSVEASYWFITEKEKFERKGYAVSRANSGGFREALTTIVDGIGAGVFPANPGKRDEFRRSFEHCRFCAYDSICARDRDRQWRRKREAEAIEPYRLLAAEETDDDD
jgi:ATP-dependent helicase/DNAse subunit B